ncbi:hypothetical protein ACFTSF_30685 [Kribbella sp. NPDC056951]|uniref:hypothetical protein n=1 Tax=Kribbella sp. NPDC056951 TaxID=3345978 RepID=UPI0036250559
MTHDLADKFTTLTDDRPEPIDPAGLVRTGITRRRRRRTTVGVLATAAITAAALTAAPLAGALLRPDTQTAATPKPTLIPKPTLLPKPTLVPQPTFRLPDPWVHKAVPGTHDLYHFAQGKVGKYHWIVGARHGCVVFQNANLWRGISNPDTISMTSGEGPKCKPDGYPRLRAGLGREGESIGILAGTTTAAARKVRVTHGKHTYVVDAVGTPASTTKRFFAVAFEGVPAPDWTAVPLDANGRPIR